MKDLFGALIELALAIVALFFALLGLAAAIGFFLLIVVVFGGFICAIYIVTVMFMALF